MTDFIQPMLDYITSILSVYFAPILLFVCALLIAEKVIVIIHRVAGDD